MLGGGLTSCVGGLCIARTAARELVSFGAAAPKVAAYRAPLLENWSRATDIKKWPTPRGWPNGGHKKMASPEGLAKCHQVSGSDRTANSATITTTLNANSSSISRSIFVSPMLIEGWGGLRRPAHLLDTEGRQPVDQIGREFLGRLRIN